MNGNLDPKEENEKHDVGRNAQQKKWLTPILSLTLSK